MQIWPNSESPCIWMEAGIIDFKLCDRHHTCDECPFNKIMTNGRHSYHFNYFIDDKSETQAHESDQEKIQDYSNTAEKSFDIFDKLRYISFNPDLYYSNYYWFSELADETKIRIGLNDSALNILPPLKEIIITQPGVTLERGQPLCWLFTNIGSLSFNAPLSGVVTNINPKVLSRINRFNKHNDAWLLELSITDLRKQLKSFLKGEEAKKFLLTQQNMVIDTFEKHVKSISSELEPTLQDGGMPLYRLENVIGPHKYLDIITKLFHEKISG